MDIATKLNNCQQLIRSGKYQRAEAECRGVLEVTPEHPGALNLLACIRYHGNNPEEAEQAYRQALELAPDCATLHINLGRMLAGIDRVDEAIDSLHRAIALRPGATECTLLLARLQHRRGDLDGAELRYRDAIASDPACAACHRGLGDLLLHAERPHEAMVAFGAAIDAKPDDAEAFARLARVQRTLGLLDEARESHRYATVLDPHDADKRLDFAHTLLLSGELAEGWELFEARRARAAVHAITPPQCPQWRGEPLDRKHIVLLADERFGDTIQFIRFVPLLKRLGARVTVACPQALQRLLSTAGGIDRVVTDAANQRADFSCPLLSLPRVLRTQAHTIPASIPYLSVPEGAARCDPCEFDRINVGLVWRSGDAGAAPSRHCPLHHFETAMRMQGFSFNSLQRAPSPQEADLLAACGVPDRSGHLNDFADTAACVDALDLVIAVDDDIAHLAAAMGKPVWLITEMDCDWRWQRGREDSPWYPTLRLFRQKRPGDCVALTGRLTIELARLVGGEVHLSGAPEAESRLREAVFMPPSVLPPEPAGTTLQRDCRHGRLRIRQADPLVGRSLALYGEYCEGELELLQPLLRRGDVLIDARAGVGAHTVALARLVGPPGHVLAFEARPGEFALLEQNLRDNGLDHATAQHAALRERCDTGAEVAEITIDSLALETLRLIKADLGGDVMRLLRGAERTLEHLAPILYLANEGRAQSPALIEYLLAHDYRMWWHTPPLMAPGAIPDGHRNVFGDTRLTRLLCIPRALSARINGLKEVAAAGDWPH